MNAINKMGKRKLDQKKNPRKKRKRVKERYELLKSDFNPFLSSVVSYSRTFFDYGEEISTYYLVLEQNQSVFDNDNYDYNTALANVDNFELAYGDILYQKQILNSITGHLNNFLYNYLFQSIA